MKSSKVVAGIITGLAIGASIGVLFAPDKGDKTRKKIASGTKDAKDKLKESFDDFIEIASEKYATIKEEGEAIFRSTKEDMKDTFNKKKEDLKDSIIKETKQA